MEKLLRTIYKPVAASPEFKEGLLEHLTHELDSKSGQLTMPLWKQPRLFVSIAVVLIIAAIGYGIWLPLTF
jgi:hypothetical protein